jgi:hypothetical protein
MAYLCSDGTGVWCALYGWRVEYKERYGKWKRLGLYCDRAAAQFAVDHIHATKTTRIRVEYAGEAINGDVYSRKMR